MADPYQLWRRGEISYETYLAKINEKNIPVQNIATTPIPSDYDMVIASTTTITGSTTVAAPNGILVADTGTLNINDGVTLTVNAS